MPPLEEITHHQPEISHCRIPMGTNLSEQTESHIVIGLLGFFFLLFDGGRGGTTSGFNSGSYVGDQILDVDVFEGLDKQTEPVGLDVNVGGLQDGRDFLIGHSHIVVDEDQRRVRTTSL